MTFNLEAEHDDPKHWTALQTEIILNVALAKRDAFIFEAERMTDFIRLGFVTRAVAADYLQAAAVYN